ncbi:MAG: L,D-transpeptidase [Actinomycetota bacterium]|nr:L,D-transpeptidase [Actinomycetota bacterium]
MALTDSPGATLSGAALHLGAPSTRGRQLPAALILVVLAFAAVWPAAAFSQDVAPQPAPSSSPAPTATAAPPPEAITAQPTPAPTPAPAPAPAEQVELVKPAILTNARIARWAFLERSTVARAEPSRTARKVAFLSRLTPERTQNLVLILERVNVGGQLWLRVRLPVLPNNSTGWLPRTAISGYETVQTHLYVDTKRFKLQLKRLNRTIFTARIGVGRKKWPTPTGEFYVRNVLRGFKDPVYGPVAFGTSARSAVLTDWPGGGFIGIHGTNKPGLLPGRVSHGCIRLRNRDILRLAKLMPVGTPVTVR